MNAGFNMAEKASLLAPVVIERDKAVERFGSSLTAGARRDAEIGRGSLDDVAQSDALVAQERGQACVARDRAVRRLGGPFAHLAIRTFETLPLT